MIWKIIPNTPYATKIIHPEHGLCGEVHTVRSGDKVRYEVHSLLRNTNSYFLRIVEHVHDAVALIDEEFKMYKNDLFDPA